jgi:hypothetical protein
MSKLFKYLSFALLLCCGGVNVAPLNAAEGDESTTDEATTDETTSDESTSQKQPADNKVTPPPAVTRAKAIAPKSREYNLQNDIDHFFSPDELKPLLAGDSDFYVLFRDDMTGRPKGVALLIPDWGLNAANSRGMEYLRTQLGDYGWVTLAMAVPQNNEAVFTTPPRAPADSTDSPVTAPATSSNGIANQRVAAIRGVDDDFFASYQLQMKMRMQALTSEAENYQGYFIVIAQGSSAAVLANLYAKGEIPEPEAFILLSAALPDAKLNQQMNLDIATTAIPTLDIYQSRDTRWQHNNIKLRRKLSKKHFKVHYRQKELYGDISYHNQNQRLLKSIYGWLSSIGI